MTRAFQSLAATCLTPVKGLLIVLSLVVVVALSSEETNASATNPVCCGGGWLNPFPYIPPFYYPPTTPTTPPASPAQSLLPGVGLTQVGNPIWKPVDFQLFSAPADTDAAFAHTIDQLLPLEGPGAGSYTPHAGPYDTELSTNAAAAGFVNKTVFPKSAITLNPHAIFFSYMLIPSPGVTGSSRDFSSGAVIPNSLFPFASKAEMYLNGSLVETLQDQSINIRTGDMGFTGASHRAPSQASWYPWANSGAGPGGNHELRWTLRDNQNNGWNMVASFSVIPEPGSLTLGGMGLLGVVGWRRRRLSQGN